MMAIMMVMVMMMMMISRAKNLSFFRKKVYRFLGFKFLYFNVWGPDIKL